MDPLPFSKKIALIIGSGRGIGKAIALHFAHQGAEIVAFLCSPAAKMIVGQTIVVDGGYILPIQH